jgi:hypothetical protein
MHIRSISVLEDEGMSGSEVPVVNVEDNDLSVHGAALETAEDEGKLMDTEAPVSEDAKVFSLHDLEFPISIVELQKYGGAQGAPLAFMARKQEI